MFATSPDVIFNVGPFGVTNSLFTVLLVSALICLFAISFNKRIQTIPGRTQALIETLVELVYNLSSEIAGKKKGKVFFPWVMTFLILILLENWTGLLPILGAIKVTNPSHQLVDLFRSPNTDLNSTIAMALISAIMTQFYGIKYLGIIGYIKRFFGLNPMHQFSGFIELIGEFAKILTLSFRLFGNIFAGDTLLNLASGVTAILLPIPIIAFESFVGLIQAVVFSILTLVFMSIMSTKPVE